MKAYEDAICRTATQWAPWYVIPADTKWHARLVVASAIIDGLEAMELAYPEIDMAKGAELEKARAALEEPRA